ncbi:methyltransferase domain-containing protein [Eubacteriales bacterium OttesenSCG-928-A19]|nr:methyltransferase domain-containing protein [Eubacteriales bacterium OttesenSCG-928-A19]
MERIEEMRAFFAARVDGYDDHMLTNIRGIAEGYARMADLLPDGARSLLDLGCGTGLELEPIFARFPALRVTGIDLTQEMLDALRAKCAGRDLDLICGSYFDVDLGETRHDAAISFETLHHFTYREKLGLYRRVRRALRPRGVYIEADYMVDTQAEEDALFAARDRMVSESAEDAAFWHIDVPMTVDNQERALREAGFATVERVWRCEGTVLLRAEK